MSSKILSEAEIDEILSFPYHTHRQFYVNLKQAIGLANRMLVSGERRVHHGSLSTINQNRILAEIGVDGQAFRGDGFNIRDKKVVLLDISQATMMPQDTIVVDDHLLTLELKSPNQDWRETGYWTDLRSGFGIINYDPATQDCIVADPEPLRLVDTRGYFKFYSLAATVNFGHFVHDLLLQAAFYHLACEKSGSRLIPILARESEFAGSFDGFRYPMQKILFEALIGDASEIIYLNRRNAVANKCYTTTAVFSTTAFAASGYAAEWLRKAVSEFDFKAELPTGISSRLWVSRADGKTDKRKEGSVVRDGHSTGLDNTHLLDDLAENCGYTSIIVGQFTPRQVIGAFRNATSIAGLHGAGLMNILFAPRDANLIEVKIAPWTWESVCMSAEALGHRTHRIDVVPGTIKGDYSVDLAELSRVLGKWQ